MGDNYVKSDIIINLINDFVNKNILEKISVKDILSFRDEYDDLIDNNRNILISEIGEYKYELLDDIYMILEMYEEDENIRKIEKYCIDEHQLMKKISEKFECLRK